MPRGQNIIIGDRILKNLHFLKRLSRSRSETRRWKLLKSANTDELLTLVEICSNILRQGQFCLSNKQQKGSSDLPL
jgi:hypothetical protein